MIICMDPRWGLIRVRFAPGNAFLTEGHIAFICEQPPSIILRAVNAH